MSLQILIVEDHGDTRRILAGLLGQFGHSVSAADSVESAKAFIKAKRFDAVVSDVGLPDGTGYDVIRHAKRRQPVTGVALTAWGEPQDMDRSRKAGFDYHLTKPVDCAALRELLDQIAGVQSNGLISEASDARGSVAERSGNDNSTSTQVDGNIVKLHLPERQGR